MSLKTLLLGSLCSIISCAVAAQEIIHKKNGSSEKAKILEISTRTVSYKMWDYPDGPTMIIPIREVRTIEFADGLVQKFGRDDMLHTVRNPHPIHSGSASSKNTVPYGKTIIAAAPIYMTNTSIVGVSASVEYLADKHKHIGLYLPIGFSFNNPSATDDNARAMLWAYPGIKYYPTGNDGVARFAMGPSLLLGAGTENRGEVIYNKHNQTYEYKEFKNHIFLAGFMLNHSLNIQPTPKLYLGLEFAIGIPYFISETEDLGSHSTYNSFDNGAPLVQFQCKLGYRF